MISIEELTTTEKVTLGLILREKIVETHDLQKIITSEVQRATVKSNRDVFKSALENVLSIRKDCYSIAKKLGIK